MITDYGRVCRKPCRKLCVRWGFWREGTTPNTCCFELSQGQGKQADTESSLPSTRLLKVSEGLENVMLSGRSADNDKGQSTHKQLSFTLVPTVRRILDVDMLDKYACSHANFCTAMYICPYMPANTHTRMQVDMHTHVGSQAWSSCNE
jgi:hypothetical protein